MLQILEYTEGKTIAAKATKKFSESDYCKLLPLVINGLKQSSAIRLYIEMGDFEGWETTKIWENMRFDVIHGSSFDKVAMLGEQKWQQWMTDFTKPFASAEVRYFEPAQKKEAIEWIKG